MGHCHCSRGLGAAQGPQRPEGFRCSEMHSQPYLRCFFWCAGLSGRSTIIFFSWNQSTIIFLNEFQGTIIFFKEYLSMIIFFNSIHGPPPPPPPWISNGQCLNFVDVRLNRWFCSPILLLIVVIELRNGTTLVSDMNVVKKPIRPQRSEVPFHC